MKIDVVEHYATLVHATYTEALNEAKELDRLIGAFTDQPSADVFEEIKKQWVKSRFPYSQSEVFRFYDGPIDDEFGFEGWINAWPIDEAYLDYVRGKPESGIINDLNTVRGIDDEVLYELNEQGGEVDICTGYHAMEFLLWGQDFYPDSAGKRPFEDFTTKKNSKRRCDALQACSRLLVTHLSSLVADWAPESENYRKRFVASGDEALASILTGMTMLAGFELASERLAVAYDTQEQEDEHSCFSDTTHFDLINNIQGIQNVWQGSFDELQGTGYVKFAAMVDKKMAQKISLSLQRCLNLAEKIPVPFDQAVLGDDESVGRLAIINCIEELESLGRDFLFLSENAGLDVRMDTSP